jgi:hypothetical protein
MQINFVFWRYWLIAVTIGVMLFGATMVVAPNLTRQLFGVLFFSSPEAINGFDNQAVAYISLIHAVLGAVMFGWGTAILFIVLGPFSRISSEAWLTLVVSLAAWFIPDTLFSFWSGFWQNAVLNIVFIVLFAIPLVATYRMCHNRRT